MLKNICKSNEGFSIVQAIIGSAILVVLAMGIVQLISSTMRAQRQSSLRSAREQITLYYSELIRNTSARNNTIAASNPENKVLSDHVKGIKSEPAGTWTPPKNINGLVFYDASNKLAVPLAGLNLMANGGLCPQLKKPADDCDPAQATWRVQIQWISRTGVDYELRAVVDQVKQLQGDIGLKEYTTKSVNALQAVDWFHATGDNIYRDLGNIGVGINDPQQKLQVNGALRISSNTGPDKYYMDIMSVPRVAGDIYYDFVIKDWLGLQDVAAFSIRGQDGYVGIGTINPVANLHLSGGGVGTSMKITNTDAAKTLLFLASDQGNLYIQEQSSTANRLMLANNGNLGVGLDNGVMPAFKIDVNGVVRAQSFVPPSDERWKKRVKKIFGALEKIMRLEGVEFFWRAEEFPEKHFPTTKQVGVLAQDVEKIFPEVVYTDAEGYKSVDYSKLVAPLIEAVKTQQLEIQRLEKRIAELERRQ